MGYPDPRSTDTPQGDVPMVLMTRKVPLRPTLAHAVDPASGSRAEPPRIARTGTRARFSGHG
jgi:hypothetical protein